MKTTRFLVGVWYHLLNFYLFLVLEYKFYLCLWVLSLIWFFSWRWKVPRNRRLSAETCGFLLVFSGIHFPTYSFMSGIRYDIIFTWMNLCLRLSGFSVFRWSLIGFADFFSSGFSLLLDFNEVKVAHFTSILVFSLCYWLLM